MKNYSRKEVSLCDVWVDLDERQLLVKMVEELAAFRKSPSDWAMQMPTGLEQVESSFVEAYVSGAVFISEPGQISQPPFVAPFLFTCLRPELENYTCTWTNSLS